MFAAITLLMQKMQVKCVCFGADLNFFILGEPGCSCCGMVGLSQDQVIIQPYKHQENQLEGLLTGKGNGMSHQPLEEWNQENLEENAEDK
jgi:hypothetical protein